MYFDLLNPKKSLGQKNFSFLQFNFEFSSNFNTIKAHDKSYKIVKWNFLDEYSSVNVERASGVLPQIWALIFYNAKNAPLDFIDFI